jgi:DNA polymerase elongation subunit (family B)
MNKLDVKLLAFNSHDEEMGDDCCLCTNKEYIVQMFGLNKDGEKICIKARNFRPYFYIKIGDDWDIKIIGKLIRHLNKLVKDTMKNKQLNGMGYYEGGIVKYITTKKKKIIWI